MRMNRRDVLRASTALACGLTLTGCLSAQSAIALAQAAIADVQNIEAGINALLAEADIAVPPVAEATINGLLDDVDTALGALNPGALVPAVTVAGVFSDLQQALNAVAAFAGGNPLVIAAQIVLAALAAVWGIVAPASAVAGGPTLAQARATLAALPRRSESI
jgi:hypothetical protein